MPSDDFDFASTIAVLDRFSGATGLTNRVANLEYELRGRDRESVSEFLSDEGVQANTLAGALAVKRMAGQINVIVHALGILLALPAILEDDEQIEQLSLGAGNTGRRFDLVTNRRIAEFKFINWRGGPEAIRQNSVFVDLYHLAEAQTDKRRELYVTDLVYPIRFLQGRRSMRSVLTKHGSVAEEFFTKFGDRYQVVCDYWDDVKDRVKLIDITVLVPAFAGLWIDGSVEATGSQ